jgi:hypothetical protein
VPSTRPLAQAVDDSEPAGRSSSIYTLNVLANDYNPFAADGGDLTVVDAFFEGASLGASVTHTASTVRVTTGTAKSGTISVIYVVRDATNTEARQVQGRVTVVVASVPEPVTSITLTNPTSQTVTVVFQAPSSSNGAEITAYSVRIAGSPSTATRTDCAPGASCTFTARINGSVQTVDVGATNKVGTTWSTTRTITPYGRALPPASASISASSDGSGEIYMSWARSPDWGGGTPNYQWKMDGSNPWTSAGTSLSAVGYRPIGGTTSFAVRVCNSSGLDALCSGAIEPSSPRVATPTASPTVVLSRGAPTGFTSGCASGNCYYFHINAQYFSPNTNFAATCLSNDGSGEVSLGTTAFIAGTNQQLRFDGSGAFNGDIYCWDGFGNVNRVVINGTSSNTSDF